MTLSLLEHPLAWETLTTLPGVRSSHASPLPTHQTQLLASLDGRPAAAFLLHRHGDRLDCVASAYLDSPSLPLVFASLIPYARSLDALAFSITFPLLPPPRALHMTPDAYTQQLPFDPELLTPTLDALLRAGALPSPGWSRLPHGLLLATLSLSTRA